MKALILALTVTLLGLAIPAGAAYVTIVSPFNYTVNGSSTVQLGNVGPGQTFFITISSKTANATGYILPLGWNKLVATNLPAGWIAQNSSLNNNYLSTEITVAPKQQNGTYTFNITAINLGNYSKLGSLEFTISVNVTPNVFKLNVSPQVVTAGPGQPADVYVTINNTGVSDTPFVISMGGLPAWNTTDTVIALHHTTGSFKYPIYDNEPGVYKVRLYVNSTASPLISKQSNLSLVVGASLMNDYSALGQGEPLFPIIYEPAYAVMYFIGLLARLI